MRGSPLRRGAWAFLCVALTAAALATADEPLDEIVVGARIASIERIGKTGVTAGIATLEVDLRVLADASEVRLRILRGSREPWVDPEGLTSAAAIEWIDEAGRPFAADTLGALSLSKGRAIAAEIRVPLRGSAAHEILIEATGLVDGRSVRTETALRAPLDVPGFVVEDDGETAAFALEARP